MDAIVLAGGLGTRLREVVKDVPKPMADIHGRPFLSYVLDYLAEQGIRKAYLSVGYKHELIQDFFGGRYGSLAIEYVVEEEQRGTGGAIREALRRTTTEQVIVVNGDTFFAVDYERLSEYHISRKADITLALKPMRDFDRYGSIRTDPTGRITAFCEKTFQKSGNINAGVYIVTRAHMGGLEDFGTSFSFESDFLGPRVHSLAAYALVSDDYFIDIGITIDYKKAQQELPQIMKDRMRH